MKIICEMSTPFQESVPPKTLVDSAEDASLFISHEIRTPLTSLQGALGLINTGHFGELSHQGQELLQAAIRSTERLTRLASAIEQQPYTMHSLLSAKEMGVLQLENEFTSIFNLDDFHLWYQPIVSMQSQQVIGFEALARWYHPEKGLISPEGFIPLAEKTGLIHPLGLDLLRKACQMLKVWQDNFSDVMPLTVSVNLSTVQLRDPHLFKKIRSILEEAAIPPGSLGLEITESTFIENHAIAQETLLRLRDLGTQLYLDDFGTGYSSLARLQDLPLNTLKIDRAFVRTQNWTISEAVINLATKLGLDVIAEGIETVEDLETLRAMGCKKVQGYFFSRPITGKSASILLKQQALAQTPAPHAAAAISDPPLVNGVVSGSVAG